MSRSTLPHGTINKGMKKITSLLVSPVAVSNFPNDLQYGVIGHTL